MIDRGLGFRKAMAGLRRMHRTTRRVGPVAYYDQSVDASSAPAVAGKEITSETTPTMSAPSVTPK